VNAWLNRAIHVNDEIALMREELLKERERAESITSKASDAPRGGSHDFHKFDNLAILDEKISRRVDELTAIKAEIIDVINLVDNGTYRRILFRRHVSGKTWTCIADEMNYSETHVQRLHEKALLEVVKIFERDRKCYGMLWSGCDTL
jgi:DNA-directed RNA polymerase specialized sigma subunit